MRRGLRAVCLRARDGFDTGDDVELAIELVASLLEVARHGAGFETVLDVGVRGEEFGGGEVVESIYGFFAAWRLNIFTAVFL